MEYIAYKHSNLCFANLRRAVGKDLQKLSSAFKHAAYQEFIETACLEGKNKIESDLGEINTGPCDGRQKGMEGSPSLWQYPKVTHKWKISKKYLFQGDLDALCVAGSASRTVCIRCVGLRAALPLEPCRSGGRDPRCRFNSTKWHFQLGFVLRKGLEVQHKQQPCRGISIHADSHTDVWFLAAGMDVTLLLLAWGSVHWHPLRPEPGLLSEGWLGWWWLAL